MVDQIASRMKHGEAIGTVQGDEVFPNDSDNLWKDDVEFFLNLILEGLNPPVLQLPAYTFANVPDASDNPSSMIFVTDEGNPPAPLPAFSRGSQWLRVTDGLPIVAPPP